MIRFLLICISLLFPLLASAQETSSLWSTRAFVPGEKGLLTILIDGEALILTDIPKVEGLNITHGASGTIMLNRKRTNAIQLIVVPEKEGSFQIPPISLQSRTGRIIEIKSAPIKVYPTSKIQWFQIPNVQENIEYGVLWALPDNEPYVNQSCLAWLKIYVPKAFTDMQIPTLDTQGLAITRFESPLYRVFGDLKLAGDVLINGRNYNVGAFSSNLTPIRPGTLEIGPGDIVGFFTATQEDARFGIIRTIRDQLSLPIPKATFRAKPLPDGAPMGYKNALGNFTISAVTEATDLSLNEPISVTVTIRGSGNLDRISCPELAESVPASKAWKLYPANKLNQSNSKSVSFQLLMRPMEKVDVIPPFELVFFNPTSKKYEIAQTTPIPLTWKGSATPTQESLPSRMPPPAENVPVEEMVDIFGPLPNATMIPLSRPFLWLGLSLIPGISILFIGIYQKVKTRWDKQESQRKLLSELNQIPRNCDDLSFIKATSHFIELNLPEDLRTPEIKNLLTTRDEFAFAMNAAPPAISPKERKNILKKLRTQITQIAPILIILCLVALTPKALSQTPQQNYDSGNFNKCEQEIIKELTENPSLNLPEKANLYFLLGDAQYRQGKTGEAMFHWYKAIQISPDFSLAKRNIAFVQRKNGIITKTPPTQQPWFEFISGNTWFILGSISLGILALALSSLCIPYLRKFKTTLWASGTLSLIICGISSTALYLSYNQNPLFSPLLPLLANSDEPYGIILENSALQHDANSTSPPMLTISAGTSAKILALRGSWAYIELPNQSQGWIPKKLIRDL